MCALLLPCLASPLFRMSCRLERYSLHKKVRRAFSHGALPSSSLSACLYATSSMVFSSVVNGMPQNVKASSKSFMK